MATGRYAPSPTGTFHLGNIRTAVAAWLFARAAGSEFLLRWEDLDTTAHPDHEAGQRRDLDRLGIDFDGAELRQSTRRPDYQDAIADLTADGLTYPCWCSRREIREATAAPHGTPSIYPGTCRDLSMAAVAAHRQSGRPPALRLRSHDAEETIVDRLHGPSTSVVDDFVLARGDGTPAYNLVVVLDDGFQGVEEVVRGADLLDSTPRHAHLQSILGIPQPSWAHVPLVTDTDGNRLAKRDGSNGLDHWLEAGGTVGSLLSAIGRTLGVEIDGDAHALDLVDEFDPTRIPLTTTIAGPAAELSLLR